MLDSVDEVDDGDVSRATMAGEVYTRWSRCDVRVGARQRREGEVDGLGDPRRSRSNTAKVYALQTTDGLQDA